MITITPQGNVYLCKTPLENDYKNQLTFANARAQQTYFASKVAHNYSNDDFTYIKKDNQIKIDAPIDKIIDCNYLYYQNAGFTNKYYYCFITDMEYVNENCTKITIETDVFQTYMFDIVKKACFVEREHVNDDSIGSNTLNENLDTGDFIVNNVEHFDELASGAHVVIGISKLPQNTTPTLQTVENVSSSRQYNGIYSGLYYLVFETYNDASKFINLMDYEGIGENVYSVFLVPTSLYNTTSWSSFSYGTQIWPDLVTVSYNFLPNTSNETSMLTSETVTINDKLNNYTPKNNKLFTKQFNYLYITNNNGNGIDMAYEDFISNTPKFNIIGAICPGCSIKLIPQDYKLYSTTGSYKNDLSCYGLVGGKYPTCSWASDTYTNWLTQNGVNSFVGNDFDIGSQVVAGVMGSPALALGGFGLDLISGAMEQKRKRETSPIQAKGNINSGDVMFSASLLCFSAFQLSIRSEYAQKIDNYFSMFGYKVNEVKIPNVTGRPYWNYVKTIDCNFEGNIPQMYLNKIKEMFNNGVTFWHDPTKFLDYSQNNTIVTPTP